MVFQKGHKIYFFLLPKNFFLFSYQSIPTCPEYIAPHKRRANSNAFQYGGRSGAFF